MSYSLFEQKEKHFVKLSDIMKHVRKVLEAGDCHYICHILSQSVFGVPGTKHQKDYLKRWVEFQLKTVCFGQWICNHHLERYQEYQNLNSKQKAQARLPWVDWMIAELEKTGE